MNVPAPRHGEICAKVVRLIGNFVEDQGLGRVVGDCGVITQRNPDTVRRVAVAYFTCLRVPEGPMPEGYLPIAPELVFEVRLPTDRWKKVLAKVAEYFNGGVEAVCVLDAQTETARVFFEDQPPQIFQAEQELVLPELLPGLQVRVRRFFE